jgi:hypothetical protein
MASVEDLEWMIPLTCGHRAQIPGPRLEERLRALYCTGCWAFVTPASRDAEAIDAGLRTSGALTAGTHPSKAPRGPC